jgi:hypothetical protein
MASIITPNWKYIFEMLGEIQAGFFDLDPDRDITVFDNPATYLLELIEAGAIVDPATDEPRQLSDLYEECKED